MFSTSILQSCLAGMSLPDTMLNVTSKNVIWETGRWILVKEAFDLCLRVMVFDILKYQINVVK